MLYNGLLCKTLGYFNKLIEIQRSTSSIKITRALLLNDGAVRLQLEYSNQFLSVEKTPLEIANHPGIISSLDEQDKKLVKLLANFDINNVEHLIAIANMAKVKGKSYSRENNIEYYEVDFYIEKKIVSKIIAGDEFRKNRELQRLVDPTVAYDIGHSEGTVTAFNAVDDINASIRKENHRKNRG
jgi:hypothetical protein